MSIRSPLSDILAVIYARTDINSIFCLAVVSIVVLVLGQCLYPNYISGQKLIRTSSAYLTNPTESSFRAYLTEQSFRQHISRLDDAYEEAVAHQDRRSLTSVAPKPVTQLTRGAPATFPFASRASVSLRTPRHIFHNFAILTVASMAPLVDFHSVANAHSFIASDLWYVGAFGRWWRMGPVDFWCQDFLIQSKEEGWSSGVFHIHNLDGTVDPTSASQVLLKSVWFSFFCALSSIAAAGYADKINSRS